MAQKPPKAITKATFTLKAPFPKVPWPVLSDENQTIVLEKLCSLLVPIVKRRSDFVQPSKGKRNKRKRTYDRRENQEPSPYAEDEIVSKQSRLSKAPPQPEVASFWTVGFNSTERALEAACQQRTPSSSFVTHSAPSKNSFSQMVAVFVDRADQTPALYAHLPLLVSTASLYLPADARIRLVALPRGAASRLSAVLQIPRTSMIGLYCGAPDSALLVDFVRKHVSSIEVPWLKCLKEGKYFPVEIATKQIAVPEKVEKPIQTSERSQSGSFQ